MKYTKNKNVTMFRGAQHFVYTTKLLSSNLSVF